MSVCAKRIICLYGVRSCNHAFVGLRDLVVRLEFDSESIFVFARMAHKHFWIHVVLFRENIFKERPYGAYVFIYVPSYAANSWTFPFPKSLER
jgi:hypothetical protein